MIPQINQAKLWALSGICLLTMALGAAGNAQQPSHFTAPFVRSLFYVLDPLLLQLVSLGLVALIIHEHYPKRAGTNLNWSQRAGPFLLSIALLSGAMIFLYVLETYFLKPAFEYTRPPSYQSDSFLVQWIRPAVGGAQGACPSGFVLRQTWLIFIAVTFLVPGTDTGPLHPRRLKLYFVGLVLATLGILFGRIGTNAHTQFDVAIAVGTGAYCYVICYFFISKLFFLANGTLYTDTMAISCLYLPLFFFYSQDATNWSIAIVVILSTLGLVEMFVPKRGGVRP